MPFDSIVMAGSVTEVRRTALNSQVTKIYQPTPEDLFLHLRAGGSRYVLLFSVHPQRFRLHYVRETPPNPPAPPQFCMVARKHLEGAKLVRVEQTGLERVARFHFERSDGVRVLAAELMGKHSNLVLLDDGGRILDSIKHVSGRVNRVREILPNRPYLPPPPMEKPDPLTAAPEAMEAALTSAGAGLSPQHLVKSLANVGPFLAKEALARAASPTPEAVTAALSSLMERVRGGEFSPALLLDEQETPVDAWAFESRTVAEDRQEAAPSMSLALEVAGQCQTRSSDTERLKEEAGDRLRHSVELANKRIKELGEALTQAENSDELRVKAELIQANIQELAKGQTEARLPNYYDPDLSLLTVELDPLLSPQENAEAYFRRHRKARASLPHLRERLAEEERRLREGERLLEEVESAGEERLRALLRELAPATQGEGRRKEEAPEENRRPAPGVRRTQSSDGYEIWYGENKEGNDTLTSRLSAPTDLWLHVRAGASAHVVIRTQKRPEAVPHRTLMEAAKIAAAHSESKHSKVVPVDYTLKKYVRKAKGSGPGKALYTHEKTLHVDQE